MYKRQQQYIDELRKFVNIGPAHEIAEFGFPGIVEGGDVYKRQDSDNPIAYNNTSITNVNGAKLWTGSSEYSNYVFDAMFARLVYDLSLIHI